MRKQHVSLSKETWDQIAREYLAGTHSTALAARHDVTQPTVVYQLHKRGIQLRSKSQTNRMRAPLEMAELIRLVEEAELALHQIAGRLGVSTPTVERTLRALSLKSKRGRGSPLEQNYFWNGGERREKEGYVLLKRPDHPNATKQGYVREHRLVMEVKLGRYLLRTEVVHHVDGDPRNNHPDNLAVFASNAVHLSHEWKTSWAAERAALRQRQAQRQPKGRRRSSPSPKASGSGADP